MNAIMKTIIASAFLFPSFSFAQVESSSAVKARLEAYAVEIATNANPEKSLEFLRDSAFIEDARDIDENLAIQLVAYAQAITDLDDYVSRSFQPGDHNAINSELTVRMDLNKPLCEVGICPEPEKFLSWLSKYKKFNAEKTAIFEKAIRKWDVVFGTTTDRKTVSWDQAGTMIVTRDSWAKMILKERNAVIAKIPYSGTAADRAFIQYNPSLGAYLDERALTFQAAQQIIATSGALTATQLGSLSGKPFDQQVYLLGQYFDGSQVSAHPELKASIDRIQSYRSSAPGEIMSIEQRQMLSSMLKTSLPNEVKGTKAGDRINSFYNGRQPQISIEYCDNCHYKYEGGKIIIDASLIEQYMRVKGYKAEDLFKNKAAVDDIARYVSPAFVAGASYQMTDEYFSSRGIYNPPVQERGTLALGMQGLYTSEKFKKDQKFKDVFTEMASTNYGSKVITTQSRFEADGSKHFNNNIAQLYFADLPSAEAARAQVLAAVNSEISRRQALSSQLQLEAESLATLSQSEAYAMGSDEFIGSVADMKMETLLKVRTDMMAASNPDSYYRGFMRDLRRDASSMNTASTAPKVPVPGA